MQGKLFEATRRFVVLKELEIHVVDSTTSTIHDDHVIRVDAITLNRSPSYSEEDDKNVASSSSRSDDVGEDDDTDYYSDIKGVGSHIQIIEESELKNGILMLKENILHCIYKF